MTLDDDVDESKDLADLSEGFTGETPRTEKPPEPDKSEPAETPRVETPKPRHRRITEDEYTRLSTAADKVTALEAQQSKAFGTIGNIQKLVNALQAQTPRGGKIEIPADAFADMERDFPELAQQNRAALEKALAGFTGTGTADADDTRFERLMAARIANLEIEDLQDTFPDWREIVGAVDITKQQPDPNNPFRKWLATKDAAYQARVNGAESARIVERAIRRFQDETKAPAKAAPAAEARRAQVAAAVQPRGDGGPPAAGGTDDDEFLEGFKAR